MSYDYAEHLLAEKDAEIERLRGLLQDVLDAVPEPDLMFYDGVKDRNLSAEIFEALGEDDSEDRQLAKRMAESAEGIRESVK